LQGFPFVYQFCGTLSEQYCQAGNAVPISFARAIARSVRESLRLLYVEEGDIAPTGVADASVEEDEEMEDETGKAGEENQAE
jgi:hypothetical protein